MSKINFAKFYELSERAEQYNKENGYRRFHTINSRKAGGLSTFGMYDYKTKKYVLSTTTSDLNQIFDEIEQLLELP